jgi:3-oxoacyl-[acyl-carrier-protein] synthase II
MNIYIRSAASISPRYDAGEPDYKNLIDARALRRMSRIIRMGVAAAGDCLRAAGVKVPDAIVTGTAYGCLEDTGVFLASMLEREEQGLQPATFIQSTHNTVGAQIALILQCTGYNNTFVHRGFSFESALLDGLLLLQEGDIATVLVGAVDEITAISAAILGRFGLYRHVEAGEGAAFFLLASEPGGNDLARLEGVTTFYNPADEKEKERLILGFLAEQGVDAGSIDLVIGDTVFADKPSLGYKELCGEYPTSTGFALWLAAHKMRSGGHRRILIYNAYLGMHHSLFLLSAK